MKEARQIRMEALPGFFCKICSGPPEPLMKMYFLNLPIGWYN